ncbi:MAG: hypothetical protein JWM02_3401 [Frankiales bacterium]|nr:hypothetical protein [Frankiales bacterium]
MLTRARSGVLLPASLVLILILGVLAAWGQIRTADQVEGVQRADRLHLQSTLSGLTGQYLDFTLHDAQQAADSVAWSLKPGDLGDERALRHVVATSPLSRYGATLASLTGQPLTSHAIGGLPSARDPGLLPLRAALAAGQGGVSNVMTAGRTSIVAFAVPVHRGARVVALLLTYADVHTWPLQGYDEKLALGESAEPYVVDAAGAVTASGVVSAVGQRLTGLPATATSGQSGVVTITRNHRQMVLSYAPAGHGWTALTLQAATPFSAGVRARSQQDTLVLIVLLTLVVLMLVSFHQKRQQALRRLADDRLYDPLTGLAQRRLFHLRLDAAVARHRRSRTPIGVLYCDLDAFKTVNDTYGHDVGDQLLETVATRMIGATREDDLVARLGGDEFAVVLEATDPDQLAQIMARLRTVVQQPVTINDHLLRPRISIGGALLRDSSRAKDLLQEADLAMYRAKHAGSEAGIVVLDSLSVAAPRT